MHMADALLSPAVGGAFYVLSGGLLAYSAARVARDTDERSVPLMGVLGAFVFAAQMINFTIPGTGSSGHLVGGLLLAILLGPYRAFLVISSVLVVQCLFFLDGGLLALGTNIFNMGVWPCFLGLLIYRAVAGRNGVRLWVGAVAASVVSLELGALGVVLETLLSGRTDLPFGRFAALMLGIHFPIALTEGIVTAAVVRFVGALRPRTPTESGASVSAASGRQGVLGGEGIAPLLISFGALAVLVGAVFAWFASPRPDGLEWSLAKAAAPESSDTPAPPLPSLARIQEKLAIMPDYDFPSAQGEEKAAAGGETGETWPSPSAATSLAGIVGALLTFLAVSLVGALLYWLRPRRKISSP